MNPIKCCRSIFVFVVAIGCAFFLHSAIKVSAENIALNTNLPGEPCIETQVDKSNNEFIFFESVSRYMSISFIK